MTPGTPGELQPPAEPVPVGQPGPRAPAAIDWSQALPAALAAGVLLAISWVIPFAQYLLWTLAGGALCVLFYARRRPGAAITPAMGARLGATAGLIGFAFFSVILAVQLLLLGGGGKLRDQLQEMVRQSAAHNPDPRVQEMIQRMSSPEGLAVMITLGMVMFLVGFVAFCAAGGAVGARLFGRRDN
jgi:hypothetical protein